MVFAESSSWNGVLTNHERLSDGCCNPLRGVKSDADYVASALKTSTDPSCWLGILTEAVIPMVNGNRNVKHWSTLLCSEAGETAIELSGRYPGSTRINTRATS